jgi:hypothetical protein
MEKKDASKYLRFLITDSVINASCRAFAAAVVAAAFLLSVAFYKFSRDNKGLKN